MNNQWRTRLIVIIAAVIIVVCAVVIITIKANNDRAAKNAAAYAQAVQPLEMELDALEKELAKMEITEKPNSLSVPTVEACCTSPGILLRDLLPTINTLNAPICIILAEDKLPGDENNITVDEFLALMTKESEYFWEYDGQDDLNAWYSRMQSAVDALGLAAPKTVYCTKGNYSTALDEALLKMGFENVIHHGEERLGIVSDLPEESGMWRICASNFMNTDFNLTVDTVLTARGNLMLEWNLDEIHSLLASDLFAGASQSVEESAQYMLEFFHDWSIGSVSQIRSLRLENHQRYLDSIEAAKQPRIELENKIQSLKEQIEALQEQAGVK